MRLFIQIRKYFFDFLGLARVCSPVIAAKWGFASLSCLRQIVSTRALLVVDRALGEGPFEINIRGVRFKVGGFGAISGIREMYIRDVYTRGGILSLSECDLVVDLGANMGNLTNFALASSPTARVIAVEPSSILNDSFNKSVALNGWQDRATLVRAFMGSASSKQDLIANEAGYLGAPWIDADTLIQKCSISQIDFLKCDIEGAEFGLLTTDSALLALTTQIAVEVHAWAGDPRVIIERLKTVGFQIGAIQSDPDGSCTVLAKRPSIPKKHSQLPQPSLS